MTGIFEKLPVGTSIQKNDGWIYSASYFCFHKNRPSASFWLNGYGETDTEAWENLLKNLRTMKFLSK